MIKIFILYDSNKTRNSQSVVEELKAAFGLHNIEIKEVDCKQKKDNQEYYLEIVRYDPDFLVTLDLAGFDMCTDTGDIGFINLTCKSIHVLIREEIREFEKYFTGKLSIAMFFYCMDHGIYERLTEKYPLLPYLREVTDYNEMIKDALEEAGL